VCPDQKANDATCLVFRLHSKNNSQSGRPVTTFEKYLVSRIGQDDSVGRISSFGFKEIKTSSFFFSDRFRRFAWRARRGRCGMALEVTLIGVPLSAHLDFGGGCLVLDAKVSRVHGQGGVCVFVLSPPTLVSGGHAWGRRTLQLLSNLNARVGCFWRWGSCRCCRGWRLSHQPTYVPTYTGVR